MDCLKERKKKVIVMEPVALFRHSMVELLVNYFDSQIDIVGVTGELSEIMRLSIIHYPVDIILSEVFGESENYKSWGAFTDFIAISSPSSLCLIWSSKPGMFISKFISFNMQIRPLQIDKKIEREHFLQIFSNVIGMEVLSPIHINKHSEAKLPALTHSEITIISGILDGYSISALSNEYRVSRKTVYAHKRNAMVKLNLSTTAELRSLFTGGCPVSNAEAGCFPNITKISEPVWL